MEKVMNDPSHDLHGNVPDQCPLAVMLIDVINDLEFPGGDELLLHALPAARRIAALARQARELGIPVIYCNDNFGRWRSDFRQVVEHALNDGVRGEPVVRLVRPERDDYFVLKPKHSGFYATTLDILLEYLGTRSLVICGFTADRCVLFTVSDAKMRDFRLHVPADCVASISRDDNERMLEFMRATLGVDTTTSAGMDLARMLTDERRD
jgi:nicotinamidase-related amidase